MPKFITRRKSILHGQRINVRLHGRANLPASHHGHIILEIMVIRASHISFDISGMRVHGHETRAKEELIVTNRVHRCHYGINLPIPTEHRHFLGRIESFFDFFFRSAGFFHQAVTVGLAHCTPQYFIHLFLCQPESVRSFSGTFLFLKEISLQFSKMFGHSFFGILLHTAVYCRIYLQAIGIQVVVLSVFLHILIAPSEQRIILPIQRIFIVLLHLPTSVIDLIRFLGGKYTP